MNEENISKRNIKIVEEMFLERDWTEGRYFDDEIQQLVYERD